MSAAPDLRREAHRDTKPANPPSRALPLTVPLLVSGASTVRRDALARALGGDAWAVLEAFWGLRDHHTGLTCAGNARLARRALRDDGGRLSARRVRTACALLHRAGLLVSRGGSGRKKLGQARVELRGREVQAFVRLVRGDESASYGTLAAVPPTTAAWVAERLRDPPRRGGRRAGAGAPRGNQNWRGSGEKMAGKSTQNLPVRGQSNLADPTPPETIKGGRNLLSSLSSPSALLPEGGEGLRVPREAYCLDLGEGEASPDTSLPDGSGGAGSVCTLRVQTLAAAVPSRAPARTSARPSPPAVVTTTTTAGGAAEGSAGSSLQSLGLPRLPAPPRSPTDHLPGAPNVPSAELLGWAVVPAPPPLLPEMSESEQAKAVADAYAGAVQSRHGRRCWAFRGPLAKSKHWPALLRLAARLLELDVAPAAWMAWSFDFWAHTRPGVPPVAWALSAKRLDERLGWFRAEEKSYAGGDVKVGPKALALARRCLLMRQVAARLGAWSGPRLDVVVRHFFPGPDVERRSLDGRRVVSGPAGYVAAVLEAQGESDAERRRLRAVADAGGFLW